MERKTGRFLLLNSNRCKSSHDNEIYECSIKEVKGFIGMETEFFRNWSKMHLCIERIGKITRE